MLEELLQLISTIHDKDRELREGSLLGQSELDRSAGRLVAWICGGLLLLTLAGAMGWWFVVGQ